MQPENSMLLSFSQIQSLCTPDLGNLVILVVKVVKESVVIAPLKIEKYRFYLAKEHTNIDG